mgnify:CR=1
MTSSTRAKRHNGLTVFLISSACLKHRHVDVQIDCRQKRRIIHCEQIKRNLIKIGLKIRELLAIIYTACLSRPVNLAAFKIVDMTSLTLPLFKIVDVTSRLTMSKWRQRQETRAKRVVLSIRACFKRNK